MNMFLHVDLDAFFASVEQLDNPELKGKPVIVGALPGSKRGVVSTCSYEARVYGVHSAMPIEQAYRLCPHGIYIRPRMKRYHEKSAEVMAVFADFSPDVQQMSVDEAFIDLSGTERLFGPPDQTALKLKKAVLERTGLTVSAGLATNKYTAKIASGLLKPDGFFYVKPGTEGQFMHSLPLKKVWGIGSKTLDRLNTAGFFTVYDIYSAPLSLLTHIFGQSGGTFLYKAARGEAAETFSEETKSRSISAENTYPSDLTDKYVIGTALMDLAQTVMFRLIKEGWVSKTIYIKIRYNDFTTCSVQETSDRIISSADDLYERAQNLFTKKYQIGNGIRLLGMGAMNLEPASQPQQRELFEFGEEKKRTIEKTILSIQEKNPEISIKKARLMKNTLGTILFCLLSVIIGMLLPAPVHAEETVVQAEGAAGITLVPIPPLPAEAPVSLFNYTINDTEVEFFAEGYWELMLSGTATATFGFGNPLKLKFNPPFFSQKVDLSVWFMLNKTWYFEGIFADGFEKNTVAAGYTGTGILKEVRLANRDIVFPQIYPADRIQRGIGGGENQAPGLSISMQGTKWNADAAIRYDMLSSYEKTYSGKNEVTDSQIAISGWKRTSVFVLPSSETAANIADVFIESAAGTYRTQDGRTYRKLSSSEYLIYPARAQLELFLKSGLLSADGDIPVVAVSFVSPSAISSVRGELENYGTPVNPGNGFLGEIQKFFGSTYGKEPSDTRIKPSVASYSFAGKNGTDIEGFFTEMQGTADIANEVLILQNPTGFSPFAAAYRYDAGKNELEATSVVSAATGAVSKDYAASVFADTSVYSGTSYIVELYRLQTDNGDSDSSNNTVQLQSVRPQIRFPAADAYPEYYLLPPQSQTLPSYSAGDPVINLQTFTQSAWYEIGTKAVPGTIRVYKNGIADTAARYDSETGIITLSSPAGDFDTVHITWYEENGDTQTGTVSAAAGITYRITDSFSAAASVTSRWPYSPNVRFADASRPLPGFATLAAEFAYENRGITVQNTAAVSVETDNASGVYRILAMDDSLPSVIALAKNAASNLKSGIIPDISANTGFPVLTAENQIVTANVDGIRDQSISGYAAVYDYSFTAQNQWTARSINLGSTASLLASAERFSIKMKDTESSPIKYDVYLQLGIDASGSTEFDPATIPVWKISGISPADRGTNVITPFVPGPGDSDPDNDWQTVTVRLTEIDRAHLAVHHDARIIIVAQSSGNVSGTLFAGPYEIINPDFAAEAPSGIDTFVCQEKQSVPGTELFNTGSVNSVQLLEWQFTDFPSATEKMEEIAFTRYIPETDISGYKTLNLFMKYVPDSDLPETQMQLILDRPSSIAGADKALCVTLDTEAVSMLKNDWKLLTVDINSAEVKIDGVIQSGCTVERGGSDIPVRFSILINTKNSGNTNKNTLFIDELYLKNISPDIIFTDTAQFSWKHEGTLVSAQNFILLSDAEISVSGTAAVSVPSEYPERVQNNLNGKLESKVDFAGISIRFDATGDSSQHNIITAAGHSFISKTNSPIFKYVPFSEIYRFDAISRTVKKQNSFGLTLYPARIPVSLSGHAESAVAPAIHTQKINSKATFSIPFGSVVTYTLSAQAAASQKINSGNMDSVHLTTQSYARGWLDSTMLAFSAGNRSASYRKIQLDAAQSISLPFASFVPAITGSISGTYSSASETTFNDIMVLECTLPFKLSKHSISFSWKKTAGSIVQTEFGGNYISDSEKLMHALNANKRLIAFIPIYDLFSSNLADTVLDSANAHSAESALYETLYDITWKRSFSGTFADFYTPSSIHAAIGREIKAAENITDAYIVKAGTGFTSFNNFGSYSKLHLFDWYEQDEYIFSASATTKIPRNEPAAFEIKLASYLQVNLYFAQDTTLKTGAEIQFEKDTLIIGKLTAIWQRPGVISPITAAIRFFVPPETLPPLKMTRSDSVNCTINQTQTENEKNFTFKIAAEHKLNILLGQFISVIVTVGASCTYSDIQNEKLITLGVSSGIGGKISF